MSSLIVLFGRRFAEHLRYLFLTGVIIKEISRRSNALISISEESKTYSLKNGVYVLDKHPISSSTNSDQLRHIEIKGNFFSSE